MTSGKRVQWYLKFPFLPIVGDKPPLHRPVSYIMESDPTQENVIIHRNGLRLFV